MGARTHGINGNEITGQLAREASLHPFIGPEPALHIPAEVSRQAGNQGLDEQETQGALTVHTRTKAG
jgi:hypothetical protein